LQTAQKEIADLYPFWQLRQASLNYELKIVGIGYVKDGASDPLQSYHTMDFPMTPKSIQQAPRPAHIQDYSTYPPKVELAVYLDFTVENPVHSRNHHMEPKPKMELAPITIKPRPGSVFVETTSSQSHESKLSGPIMHKTLMAPLFLVCLPATKRKSQMMTRLPSCLAQWNPNQKDAKERRKNLESREKKCSPMFLNILRKIDLIRIPHMLLPKSNHLQTSTIDPQQSFPPDDITAQSQPSMTPLDLSLLLHHLPELPLPIPNTNPPFIPGPGSNMRLLN